MRFVVVDTYKRFPQDISQRLGELKTDPQGAGQAGPLRGRHSVQLTHSRVRSLERSACDGQTIAQVLARGQFGNDSAILGVHLDLRRNEIGQHKAVSDDGHTRFIAGCLDSKKRHEQRAYTIREREEAIVLMGPLTQARRGFPI